MIRETPNVVLRPVTVLTPAKNIGRHVDRAQRPFPKHAGALMRYATTAARDDAAPEDDARLTEVSSRSGTRKPCNAQRGGRGLQHAP